MSSRTLQCFVVFRVYFHGRDSCDWWMLDVRFPTVLCCIFFWISADRVDPWTANFFFQPRCPLSTLWRSYLSFVQRFVFYGQRCPMYRRRWLIPRKRGSLGRFMVSSCMQPKKKPGERGCRRGARRRNRGGRYKTYRPAIILVMYNLC